MSDKSQWSLLPRNTAPRNASRARAADETASGRALRRKAQRCWKTSHNRRQAPSCRFPILAALLQSHKLQGKVLGLRRKTNGDALSMLILDLCRSKQSILCPQADFPRSPSCTGVCPGRHPTGISSENRFTPLRAGVAGFFFNFNASMPASLKEPCFFNSPDTRPTCTHWKQSKSWPSSLSLVPWRP